MKTYVLYYMLPFLAFLTVVFIYIFMKLTFLSKNIKENNNIKEINSIQLSPQIDANHQNWKDKVKSIDGIISNDIPLLDKKIDGQVFLIELLEEPIILTKEGNKTIVNINRNNITHSLYTTKAKNLLCKKCLNDHEILNYAKKVDKVINDFILGNNNYNQIRIDLSKMPLRWVSGGVFLVVEYKNRIWTPFFFRDIKPYGWNIALGASQNRDELKNPLNFLMRKFFDEIIILNDSPLSQSELICKKPILPKISDLHFTYNESENSLKNNISLRKYYDGLQLKQSSKELLPLKIEETDFQIKILSGFSSTELNNILIAINPLELGIEVVSVVKTKLKDNDYLLDGEILRPHGGIAELVRMPIALISHDYLQKSFGKKTHDLKYNGNELSSISKDEILPKNEIIIFEWDIDQRKNIINNKKGIGIELIRYNEWDKNFGKNFKKEDDHYNLPGLFTPASAKILSYYFSK